MPDENFSGNRLATFYSRSRKGRWCKGETSGNYIRVQGVYLDCDRDSVVYLGEPDGPSCHTVQLPLPPSLPDAPSDSSSSCDELQLTSQD